MTLDRSEAIFAVFCFFLLGFIVTAAWGMS
jgi:hypothetical protein